MIAQFTVVLGINNTCNVQNSIRLRLMLFWTLLVLLIPNTTVNCAITYTNLRDPYRISPWRAVHRVPEVGDVSNGLSNNADQGVVSEVA